MAGLVVAICYDVALRYVFNRPRPGVSRSPTWCMRLCHAGRGLLREIQGACAHGHDLRQALAAGKAWVDVVCYLLLFFPFLIVLTYKCADHTLWSLQSGNDPPSAYGAGAGAVQADHHAQLHPVHSSGLVNFLRALRIAVKGGAHES